MKIRYTLIPDLPVHQVNGRQIFTVAFKIFQKLRNNFFDCIIQRHIARHMGCDEQPGTCPQGAVRRNGLLLKHVQRCTRQMPAAQQGFQCLLVYCASAAYVYQESVGREKRQAMRVQNTTGLRRIWEGENQQISLR